MILLPFLALLAWIHAFHRLGGRSLLESTVAALVVFGVAISAASEVQSLIGMLSPAGSTLAWPLLAAGGLAVGRRGPARPPQSYDRKELLPSLGLAPVVLLLATTCFVALAAAPNAYDGLSYHLIRPERWIQQGSLQPFATHDTRQLFMPSWPEYAILQLRLLSGTDRFANLVQWIGYAGCMGGTALLARALGGGRLAAGLGAALVATLPMAVAQSTGTQTDVVAAWWAVTACAFGYLLLSPTPRPGDALLGALALGLAAATKQTALLFAAFALSPVALQLLRREGGFRLVSKWAVASILAVALIAGPQLLRNYSTFGNLRGDPAVVNAVAMGTRAPTQVAANVLRNLSVHFGTPWSSINEAVVGAASSASGAMGVDPGDRRTTWGPGYTPVPWTTHEESASNPLHLLLFIATMVTLVLFHRDRNRLFFAAALAAGFVTYCALFKWQYYASRLHTPVFVLALALAAVELERLRPLWRRLLLGLLFLAAIPGALVNYTRPLLSVPQITSRPSILSIPRNLHYFLYLPNLGRAYRDVALHIAESECADVGVRAWPDAWEYAVLALARRAGSEAAFRSIDVENVSARYAPDSSVPCLLLQIGPYSGRRPAWASDWQTLADYSAPLGVRGVALFAPRNLTALPDSLHR